MARQKSIPIDFQIHARGQKIKRIHFQKCFNHTRNFQATNIYLQNQDYLIAEEIKFKWFKYFPELTIVIYCFSAINFLAMDFQSGKGSFIHGMFSKIFILGKIIYFQYFVELDSNQESIKAKVIKSFQSKIQADLLKRGNAIFLRFIQGRGTNSKFINTDQTKKGNRAKSDRSHTVKSEF